MKAIEKDRNRRYDTANGFAEDIKRYLNHEPVVACPPSWGYRLRKFSRRYRAAMAGALLVTVALLAGLVGTAWQAKRATDAKRQALASLDLAVKAQQRSETEAHAAELARQRESQERQRADENFRRARQAVDEYFTLVSESRLFDEAGMAPLRKELLEAALRYYEEFSKQAADDQAVDDPDILVELAAANQRIACIYVSIDSPKAFEAFHRSLDILEKLLDRGAVPTDWQSYAAGVFIAPFKSDAVARHPEEARNVVDRGIKVFSRLADANPQLSDSAIN